MKISLLSILILLITINVNAQSSAGLIAHWDMNGTTNDVSGGGHNGIGYNISSVTGSDGIAGHALYFNGVNSYINIPYMPDMNLHNYSITANIKVAGFYAGTCHNSMVFIRGTSSPSGTGTYSLFFSDIELGTSCSSTIADTNAEVFVPGAGATGAALGPATTAGYAYTPYVAKNVWYKIITTFNDTVFKIYVNGSLIHTVTITTPGTPMGTSTQGASIGMCKIDSALGFPYFFHGDIDDICLYNRVLTDSEIVHFGDTCGSITSQPVSHTAHVGANTYFAVNTTVVAANYQWQENTGTGFIYLSNAGPFSGVNTDTLHITGITSAMNSTNFRCLVSNTWVCSDTTTTAILTATTGLNNVQLADGVYVYPNPTTNTFTIRLPITNGVGTIQLLNEIGQIIEQQNINSDKVSFDINNLRTGMYILKIEIDGTIIYKKVIKN